ncbi:MAG TPA: hypothetical protein VIL85_01595 [Thermomicrobiales bacterium]|jgi:predicted transcriptional regulator
MGREAGISRDVRGVIRGMVRRSSVALTTPQIITRAGMGKATVARHLAALEAEGVIGRIAGTPQRWCWRSDAGEAAAS